MARGWHGRRERRSFRAWRDGSQLTQRVRPVLGDHCVVGKPLQTARQFFRSAGHGKADTGLDHERIPFGDQRVRFA
jgi:hypothetical protein